MDNEPIHNFFLCVNRMDIILKKMLGKYLKYLGAMACDWLVFAKEQMQKSHSVPLALIGCTSKRADEEDGGCWLLR